MTPAGSAPTIAVEVGRSDGPIGPLPLTGSGLAGGTFGSALRFVGAFRLVLRRRPHRRAER